LLSSWPGLLLHQRSVENVRCETADRRAADVRGDVALQFGFRNSEPIEQVRYRIAGVVGRE
jgi:hypothetical protein